ncbi:hypothetical protein MXD81_22310, partial [Microbacteriaceae bacterium K1510]|nr:hypothetical protein [Microbacteriaceae bacterium K1510]
MEVNDLAIVTGAAIDKKKDPKEGEKIHLSLQVIIPRSLGGGVGGGGAGGAAATGGKTTLLRSGDGLNIADAMSQVQGKLPR